MTKSHSGATLVGQLLRLIQEEYKRRRADMRSHAKEIGGLLCLGEVDGSLYREDPRGRLRND